MTILAGILDGFGNLDPAETGVAYTIVALLVLGDGVVPILPGETTVITAATLAANHELNIVGVFLAAWFGAVAGDSIVYGIGRLGSGAIYARITKAVGHERMDSAEYFFNKAGGPLIILGRFVPGLRLGAALTAGILEMPANRYFVYEPIGGGLWALYVTVVGYYLGKEFEGHMWASLVVATIATSLIGGLGFILYQRAEAQRKRELALQDDG